MHRIITIFVALITAITVSAASPDYVPTTGKPHPMPGAIGLTLSGGGAKGIAHIGVIKALEENGIPIDCITGTSMGAIVGSLYSMAYTPERMMDLIGSREFKYWSTGRIDPELTYYFLQNPSSPANININLGGGGSAGASGVNSVLPSSLINPLPMNLAFVQLFAPYTAQCGGSFDRLMVPFRCVASDVNRKRKAIFSSGDLGDCVRASMSFPMVFHPIEIDGRPMYDGGIYDNFPIDVMLTEFDPEFVIGVDVSSGNSPDNPNANMMDQLESLIMQESNYDVPSEKGIRIKLDLDRFGLLDFDKAQEIYQIGYDKAMSMMDSIKSRVVPRRKLGEVSERRREFASRTPELVFDSVHVSGGNRRQDEYLNYLFSRRSVGDTLTMDRVRDAYYRALTSGKLRNFMPHASYDSGSGMFDMRLKATVKNDFNLGVGGYLTTTTNSMLYLSGAFRTLSFNSLDMSLSGWVGQSYLAAQADARIQLLRSTPSSIGFKAAISRQKYFPEDRFFFETSDPTVLTSQEMFASLDYGVALGRKAKASLSVGIGHDDNKFRHLPERFLPVRVRRTAGKAQLDYEYFSLDNNLYPTSGSLCKVSVKGMLGKYNVLEHAYGAMADMRATEAERHSGYGRIDADLQHYQPLTTHFSLGVRLRLSATTDKVQQNYFAALALSPSYTPAASMSNLFIPEFRARKFGVLRLEPVWSINSMFQLRSCLDAFVPYRSIGCDAEGLTRLGRPWRDPAFFAELQGVMHLSFASLSAYVHYASASGSKWNFGISFGVYLPAASFFN